MELLSDNAHYLPRGDAPPTAIPGGIHFYQEPVSNVSTPPVSRGRKARRLRRGYDKEDREKNRAKESLKQRNRQKYAEEHVAEMINAYEYSITPYVEVEYARQELNGITIHIYL